MSLRYAPDKLALLLSLVPYLADAGVVSVAEAAAHFKVTEGEIRAAVTLIALSGVPTVDNVVLHSDMFDIDWDAFEHEGLIVLTNTVAIDDAPRLSRGEVSALIAGLQYLAGIPSNTDNQLLHGLQRKLAVAGGEQGPSAITAQSAAFDETRSQIATAREQGHQLRFSYASPDGRHEERLVDPLQIESENGTWYLRAWCHSRDAVRVFRLDRMTEVQATHTPVSYSPESVSLPDTLFGESSTDVEVTLSVARSALGLLGEYLRGAELPASGDPVEVRVRVGHVHGLKRVVASYPQLMRVLGPPAAVSAVEQWAAAGLARYTAETS